MNTAPRYLEELLYRHPQKSDRFTYNLNGWRKIGGMMMRGGHGVASLLLVFVLFTGSACSLRIEPIYNPTNQPIPKAAQKLTLDEIGRNIIRAGERHEWKITPQSPGELKGFLDHHDHTATISITYTKTAYSITLLSSTRLHQSGNQIHHDYNRWIRDLDGYIDAQLKAAAPAS